MAYIIRSASEADKQAIWTLYREVSSKPNGLARNTAEITETYISENLYHSLQSGYCYLAEDANKQIVGEIHTYKILLKVFAHVLSNLTIAVHPNYQSAGIGKKLFKKLIHEVETNRPDIARIELISRESNQKAIQFYQKMGFSIEGRMEKRIDSGNGTFEADIPMAWFNQNFGEK